MRLEGEPYAIDVGTFVMNFHHKLLRLGVVRNKRVDEQGRTWCEVDYLEDDVYVRNKTHHSKMSGKDEFEKEQRIDRLTRVSTTWLQNVLNAYGENQDERRTEIG